MVAIKPGKYRLQALVKLSAYAVPYDVPAIPGTNGDAYVQGLPDHALPARMITVPF
jgi:hypothetical protein